MRIHPIFLIVVSTLYAAVNLAATTYTITSAGDFSSLPATLAAGDEIVIADGTYANVGRTLTAAGTAGNPVRMYAANPGSVYFSGGTQFVLRGSHMVISGLAFDGTVASGKPKYSSGIFRFDANSSDMILRDCLFRNFSTGTDISGAYWLQIHGYRHTVEYCSFIGKDSEDPVLNIIPTEDDAAGDLASKDTPRRHLIRHCYFGERTNIADNGYETIRIGESKYQMYDMSNIVEYCVFEKAIYGPDITAYEPEVISSKSRNNIYRYNTFIDNKGGLVLRHGDDNVIEGNFFFGESGSNMGAGVRIIGLRHIVRNNYFEKIDGTGLRAAICLMKGSGAWSDDSTNNGYETPNSAKIHHNTIVNCAEPLNLGATTSSSGTTAPTDVEIRNNVVQSSASDGPVIDFNSENGWTIGQIAFSGNHAYHPTGNYGTVPASGFTTGTPVNLALDVGFDYFIPQAGSPVINAAAATVPATLDDIRARVRPGPLSDSGCFDTEGTGTIWNRPLVKADVGPVFDGRSNPDRVPTIVSNPESDAVFEGDPVVLSVTAESALSMSYQWYRNEAAIPGATGSTYSIASALPADEGSYTVAVTNSAGRTLSFAAGLAVEPAVPVITSQPVSLLLNPGSTAVFSVVVNGIGPFNYQWRKDGIDLSGEEASSLTITDVQSADEGDYSVEVTNIHGSVISDEASLTVASGTLLLSDDFEDNDRSNQVLPSSAQWFSSSTSSSGNLAIVTGPSSLYALLVPAGRHALAYFKDSGGLSLAVGEQITANLTVNFVSVGNSSGGLRMGFFNSNGAKVTGDGNSAFLNYDGYIATTTAMYPDSNAATSGAITIRQRNTGVGTTLISTTGSGIYSDVDSSGSVFDETDNFVAGINYTFTFTVSRTATGTVRVEASYAGGDLSNYTFAADDSSGIVTGFDGFAILSTSTNGSSYTIDNVTVEHSLIPAATSLATWRTTYFGIPDNTGNAANDFDFDKDGLLNLVEYILGLNPTVPDSGNAVVPGFANVSGSDYLTVEFTRDLTAADVVLLIKAGPDLGTWDSIDPDGPNQVSSSTVGTMETLVIRDNTPFSAGTSRFMLLEVAE